MNRPEIVEENGCKLLLSQTQELPKWTYRDPGAWQNDYEACRDKPTSRQSPINIETRSVEYQDLPPFMLSSYESVHNVGMELVNNGYTARLVFSGEPIEISGGGLPNAFRLENLHFHWGASSDAGSEHLIDNRAFPMEMHIVHYNTIYLDVRDACCKPDGLAILAFFFEVHSSPNPAFSEITTHLNEITMPGCRTQIKAFPLRKLLPNNLDHFYRYEGSLTIPPCSETTIWTVFEAPVQISEDQISCFRALKSSDINPETNENFPLVNNTRPPQSLHDRVVYTNFTPSKTSKKRGLLQRCACLRPAD